MEIIKIMEIMETITNMERIKTQHDERIASASDCLYGVVLTLAVKYGDNGDIAEVSRLVAKEWR